MGAPSPRRFEIAIANDADADKVLKAVLAYLGPVIAKYESTWGVGRFMIHCGDPTIASPTTYPRCVAIIDTSPAIADQRLVAKLYRVLYARAAALGVTIDSPAPPVALATDDVADEPALPVLPTG